MTKNNFVSYLLNPKNWWLPLLIIFIVSITGVTMIGVHTYTQAPPIPSYVSSKNETVFSKEDVLKGQAVFQQYALMEYGSMFGDGANRGPDYTAEALHHVSQFMNDYFQVQFRNEVNNNFQKKGIAEQVKEEIKTNHYSQNNNSVALSDAQTFAANELVKFYTQKFTDPLGFTNFDYAGLLIDGYNQLGTFAAIYNFSYYPVFLERAGYHKDIDWVEYRIKVPDAIQEKLLKMVAIVEKRYQLNVVRTTKIKDILPFAKDIFKLVNAAYTDLYGVVDLNEKQIEYGIKKYLSFIWADFVSLVLNKNRELVAAGITIPSLSQALQKANSNLYPFGFLHILRAFKKNNLVDLCMVAIRKNFQGKGVNAILMKELT